MKWISQLGLRASRSISLFLGAVLMCYCHREVDHSAGSLRYSFD